MKKPLAIMLSMLIALPSFASETVSKSDLTAYVAAQREMISKFYLPSDDVAKMKAALDDLQRSNGAWFNRDARVVEQVENYQREFKAFRENLPSDEWTQRKQRAWEQAEAKSPSSSVFQFAEKSKADALHQSLLKEYQAAAEQERKALERQKRAELAKKIADERARLEQVEAESQARRQEQAKKFEEDRAALAQRQAAFEAEERSKAEAARKQAEDEIARLREERRQVGRKIEPAPAPEAAAVNTAVPKVEVTAPPAAPPTTPAEVTSPAGEVVSANSAIPFAPPEVGPQDPIELARQAKVREMLKDRPPLMDWAMRRIPGETPATTAAGATHKQKDEAAAARPISAPTGKNQGRVPPSSAEPKADAGPGLTQAQIYSEIKKIAKKSGCIGAGRGGHAVTEKYLLGLTYGFARSMCRPASDPVRTAMTGTRATQIASADGSFQIPNNDNQLNAIYQNILSLGLYESDGRFAEGRDRSTSNTNGTTTEAGFLQTSYNVHGCNQKGRWAPAALGLISDYKKAGAAACGKELLNGGSSEQNYGSGAAFEFQKFVRTCPLGAVEHAAITLKNCSKHYGPWNSGVARAPVGRCDKVFKQVAALVSQNRESNCQALALPGGGSPRVATTQGARR